MSQFIAWSYTEICHKNLDPAQQYYNETTVLSFVVDVTDLNTKLTNIFNLGYVALRLLTWDH
jgi:hypothetical protein